MHKIEFNLNNSVDSLKDDLSLLAKNFSGRIVFSTSFGVEDQVITDAIFSENLNDIEVFTLDTGRLFDETYNTWERTLHKYKKSIKSYYPKNDLIEEYATKNGINAFYESVNLRKDCCFIRKVEPLSRALKGADLWITGLRSEQSNNRSSMQAIEWDETHKLYKYNPLINWSLEDVKAYIDEYKVPYNSLYDKGFVSIGCAPCTRAIKKGEDFRAGRWWWEDSNKKECGLHVHN